MQRLGEVGAQKLSGLLEQCETNQPLVDDLFVDSTSQYIGDYNNPIEGQGFLMTFDD